ncbi:MAG: glycoside hydrolase [Candidatus Sericytochromatia bacterium]|nr:glycoside hydrolase [Candidatus Tanganyikabacteria bacterium]
MLHVAFVWHMHQPLYKDRLTGRYLMPWVRLHGIKDYLDMVAILRQYPGLHQTFNLVPSLLEQVEDYASGHAVDRALEVTLKPVADWTRDDRAYVMLRFFDAQFDNMIAPFPRYHQLALKRNDLLGQFDAEDASRAFTHQDLLDLTVWFNLAWFDPLWRRTEPELQALVQRGRGFTQVDRELVVAKQRKILARIVPEYSEMRIRGQVELTTTPFYHPILPLLVDTDSARVARPHLPLPGTRFSYPEDARHQIRRGLEYFASRFGHRPVGMWPSEQSVSPAAVQIMAEEGIRWAISDEGVLAHSLGVRLVRDAAGQLLHPDVLYRPYAVDTPAGRVQFVFRDIVLSDLIGFSYPRVPGAQAAQDLHERLKGIRARSPHPDPLVTIALDGENCWEHYAEDGWDFLRAFYDGVAADPDIRLCTVGEYLAEHPAAHHLPHLHSGSWIGSDFTTWIGDPTKNRAWDLVGEARAAFETYDGPNREEAREEILTAEGSDWFWWFGVGHDSGQDELFDEQFRMHLANAWRLMGEEVPESLAGPVTPAEPAMPEPTAAESGVFEAVAPQGAMHAAVRFINRIAFRGEPAGVFVAIELGPTFEPMPGDEILIGWFYPGQTRHNSPLNARPAPALDGITYRFLYAHEVRVAFDPPGGTVWEAGEVFTWHLVPADVAVRREGATVAIEVPTAAIGQGPGREVHFVVGICRGGDLLDVFPSDRTLAVRIPSQAAASAQARVTSG